MGTEKKNLSCFSPTKVHVYPSVIIQQILESIQLDFFPLCSLCVSLYSCVCMSVSHFRLSPPFCVFFKLFFLFRCFTVCSILSSLCFLFFFLPCAFSIRLSLPRVLTSLTYHIATSSSIHSLAFQHPYPCP